MLFTIVYIHNTRRLQIYLDNPLLVEQRLFKNGEEYRKQVSTEHVGQHVEGGGATFSQVPVRERGLVCIATIIVVVGITSARHVTVTCASCTYIHIIQRNYFLKITNVKLFRWKYRSNNTDINNILTYHTHFEFKLGKAYNKISNLLINIHIGIFHLHTHISNTHRNGSVHNTKICPGWESNPQPMAQQLGSDPKCSVEHWTNSPVNLMYEYNSDQIKKKINQQLLYFQFGLQWTLGNMTLV